MAYSDEHLKSFTQKIQELLQKKEKNYLSETDLKDIAQGLGMDEGDIDKAREDYFLRGKGHLVHGNLQEAIQEFEQLLFLSPKDAEAFYGIAEANYQLWLTENKKIYKRKAEDFAKKCIQFNPKHSKAYALIQKLKGNRLKLKSPLRNYPKAAKEAIEGPVKKYSTFREIVISTLIGLGFIISMTAFFNSDWVSQLFGSSKLDRPNEFYVVMGKKGTVAWLYQEGWEGEGNKIYIINPINGEILEEIDLEGSISDLSFVEDDFYYSLYELNDFEGRDMYTGELIDSKEILSKHYQELDQGIGEVSWNADNWIELTLKKDGSTYWYAPHLKELHSAKERGTDQNLLEMPAWYKFKKGKFSQYYLVKVQKRSSEYSGMETTRSGVMFDRLSTNEEQLSFESPEFLEAKMIYGDEKICIIRHQTEIGEDANIILSAMNTKGQIMWEYSSENKEIPIIIQYILRNQSPSLNTYQYEGTLLLSTRSAIYQDKEIAIASAIDIDNGQILWRYSPDREF